MTEKICFVIAPIGEENGEIRRRSDQVFRHIIVPVAKECGYRSTRADQLSEPGMITTQVIQHLIQDDIVIADLTGHNPNVFYELAVRHAVGKPVFQLIEKGQDIPFDIGQFRTVQLDIKDLDSVDFCRDELIKQIRNVEKEPENFSTPISASVNLQSLRQSDNLVENSYAEILSLLHDIRRGQKQNPSFPEAKEFIIENTLSMIMTQINEALDDEFAAGFESERLIKRLFGIETLVLNMSLQLELRKLDYYDLHSKHPDHGDLPF